MATTANTTKKTGAQRAREQVLNGHDQSVSDVEIKDRARGSKARGTAGAKRAEPVQPTEPTQAQYAFAAYANSLGVPQKPAITYTNMIAGFVASVCALVVGYAVGMQIADMLAYGAYLLTGWGFLAFAIWVVGTIIGMIAACYAAGKVAQYVGTGEYVKDMNRAKDWVVGKFTNTSSAAKRAIFRNHAEAA